jgi:peroxiredoxin family protein
METLNKFVDIDSQFFKIVQSWELLEKPMKEEYDMMVAANDLEKAKIRENMLNSLEKIVEICKDQRVCMATVAKEYNINVSDYSGIPEKYDPIEVLVRVFEDDYFKTLCSSLDEFVESVDVDEKFEKKTFDINK